MPRSWDVRTRVAAACLGALALAGCGQARLVAPPAPAFTSGQPPVSTAPAITIVAAERSIADDDLDDAVGRAPDRLDPVPGAAVGDGAVEGEGDVAVEPAASPGGIAIDEMLVVDDAGVAVPNESGWARFDRSLEARLIPADASASVAVMVDGRLVHQAAFGERVRGFGEPTEISDRFRIASISKTITAVVTMQLVESGQLTLDDPVGETVLAYLGLFPSDPDAVGITVRQLLTHTAGFPKHQSTFFANGASSYTDAARIGMSGSIGGASSFLYSNMNYAVLSVLIEAVTGQTYERVVNDRLLTPLGITGMRMAGTHELGPDEVSHDPTPGRNFMEALGGAGAWNATPAEVVAIYNSIDPATGGWKALSGESLAMMRAGVATSSPGSTYGLGIFDYPGGAWGHTGTIERSHSMVLVQPDGVTWAVSVSGETPSNTGSLRSIVTSALAAGFPG